MHQLTACQEAVDRRPVEDERDLFVDVRCSDLGRFRGLGLRRGSEVRARRVGGGCEGFDSETRVSKE